MDRQQMFALNLYVIIGAVIVLVVLLLLLLAAWVAVNAGIWRFRRKRAEQRDAQRKLRPDGQPYPPAARGLCDACGKVREVVYHLPSGARRCDACYAGELAAAERGEGGLDEQRTKEAENAR